MKKFYEEGAQGGGGASAAAVAAGGTVLARGGNDDDTPAQGGNGAAKADPAIQQSFWKGWINEDGTLNKGRYEHLPEDVRDLKPMLDQLDTLPDLLKTFKHQKSLVGKKGLLPLRADATDGERKEFDSRLREALSVPEKPDGYGIKRPEDIPEELWNDGYAQKMAELLHKNAVSPAAVKELVDANFEYTRQAVMQMQAQQEQQREDRRKAVDATIGKEWGQDFQNKLRLAKIGAQDLGIDPDSELFQWNAEVAIACERHAMALKEARLIDGQEGLSGAGNAKAQLAALTGDPSNRWYQALKNPNSPMFRDAVREQTRLAQLVAKEEERKAGR